VKDETNHTKENKGGQSVWLQEGAEAGGETQSAGESQVKHLPFYIITIAILAISFHLISCSAAGLSDYTWGIPAADSAIIRSWQEGR